MILAKLYEMRDENGNGKCWSRRRGKALSAFEHPPFSLDVYVVSTVTFRRLIKS